MTSDYKALRVRGGEGQEMGKKILTLRGRYVHTFICMCVLRPPEEVN